MTTKNLNPTLERVMSEITVSTSASPSGRVPGPKKSNFQPAKQAIDRSLLLRLFSDVSGPTLLNLAIEKLRWEQEARAEAAGVAPFEPAPLLN